MKPRIQGVWVAIMAAFALIIGFAVDPATATAAQPTVATASVTTVDVPPITSDPPTAQQIGTSWGVSYHVGGIIVDAGYRIDGVWLVRGHDQTYSTLSQTMVPRTDGGYLLESYTDDTLAYWKVEATLIAPTGEYVDVVLGRGYAVAEQGYSPDVSFGPATGQVNVGPYLGFTTTATWPGGSTVTLNEGDNMTGAPCGVLVTVTETVDPWFVPLPGSQTTQSYTFPCGEEVTPQGVTSIWPNRWLVPVEEGVRYRVRVGDTTWTAKPGTTIFRKCGSEYWVEAVAMTGYTLAKGWEQRATIPCPAIQLFSPKVRTVKVVLRGGAVDGVTRPIGLNVRIAGKPAVKGVGYTQVCVPTTDKGGWICTVSLARRAGARAWVNVAYAFPVGGTKSAGVWVRLR